MHCSYVFILTCTSLDIPARLDFGSGRKILEKDPWYQEKALEQGISLDSCFEQVFNSKVLHYFSLEERRKYSVAISSSPGEW